MSSNTTRVVLFVSGRGHDAASLRPNKDESQWWNRRDALVRCVAAYLFGAAADHRELALLFDQDWARLYLRLERSITLTFVPTERNVLALWKRCCQSPSEELCEGGLVAQLVVDASSGTAVAPPSSMDSKREVLEHLQRHCSMDFLRQHRLNSSQAALLRKTNKQALMQVWREWQQQDKSPRPSSGNRLECILQELLAYDTGSVVAGTLHESSENELPYWDTQPSATKPETHLVLFLGAVRDMTRTEHNLLQRVCQQATIPLLKIRLGPVAEFTSKILSVVAFHESQRVLHAAVQCLQDKAAAESSRKRLRQAEPNNTGSYRLTWVCLLPIPSSDLTVDLEQRNGILWSLVRVTVACLWRSRIAGGHCYCPVDNRLELVFGNGRVLSLHQEEMISKMSEQHQAAPCEFQVLQFLVNKLLAQDEEPELDHKQVAKRVVQSCLVDSTASATFAIDLTSKSEDTINLAEAFYSSKAVSAGPGVEAAIVLLQLGREPLVQQSKAFLRALRKQQLPVMGASLPATTDCVDRAAATVTMIQHFCYQGRLFHMLASHKATSLGP